MGPGARQRSIGIRLRWLRARGFYEGAGGSSPVPYLTRGALVRPSLHGQVNGRGDGPEQRVGRGGGPAGRDRGGVGGIQVGRLVSEQDTPLNRREPGEQGGRGDDAPVSAGDRVRERALVADDDQSLCGGDA